MRYYLIKIDENNKITETLDTWYQQEGFIEISSEEFLKCEKYENFNPKTREFYCLKPVETKVDLMQQIKDLMKEQEKLKIERNTIAENLYNLTSIVEMLTMNTNNDLDNKAE